MILCTNKLTSHNLDPWLLAPFALVSYNIQNYVGIIFYSDDDVIFYSDDDVIVADTSVTLDTEEDLAVISEIGPLDDPGQFDEEIECIDLNATQSVPLDALHSSYSSSTQSQEWEATQAVLPGQAVYGLDD